MIFVDTGAWAAFFVPADPSHCQAVTWMRENQQPLITTDYVLDELLTLLKARYGASAAIEAGERLWAEEFAEVLFLTTADIRQAWTVFRGHRDKGWSFTDCVSTEDVFGQTRRPAKMLRAGLYTRVSTKD